MPTLILLDPSNRLLHGATTDFSIFGAQPDVAVRTGPAVDTGPFVTSRGAAAAEPAHAGSAGTSAAIVSAPPVETSGMSEEIAATSPGVASGSAAQATEVHAGDTPGLFSASAFGLSGGALTPAMPNFNVAVEAGAATGAISLADAGTAAHAFLSPMLDVPSPAFDGYALGAISSGLLAPLLPSTGDALDLARDTIGTIVPAADTALHNGVDAVADTVAALNPIGAIDDLTGAVAGVLDTLAGPTDVVELVAPVTDVFAGSDPAAGLTTLTGMVATADVFDLGDTGVGATVDTTGGSILYDLMADTAGGALLGDADHHEVGLIDDGHHIGLAGL